MKKYSNYITEKFQVSFTDLHMPTIKYKANDIDHLREIVEDKVKELYKNKDTLLDLSDIDVSRVKTLSSLLSVNLFGDKLNSVKVIDLTGWNVENVINIDYFIYGLPALTEIRFDELSFDNLIAANCSFAGNKSLVKFNTTNIYINDTVRTMEYMFANNQLLKKIDVSNIDFKSAESTKGMFYHNISMEEITGFKGKKMHKIKNMSNMFESCIYLTKTDIDEAYIGEDVTSIKQMFSNCNALTALDLSNWTFPNLENATQAFHNCKKLTSVGNLEKWKCPNLKKVYDMFANCYSITSLGDIDDWTIPVDDISETDLRNMFYYVGLHFELPSWYKINK